MNYLIISIITPFIGTALGASFVFFLKRQMPEVLQKTLLGFASGVMVAASFWSLLQPSLDMGEAADTLRVMPVALGFVGGIGFLLLLDYATPHLHLGNSCPEGPRCKLSRTAMMTLAVAIHNLPEGMAVGVVLSGAESGMANISIQAAMAMAVGIAIQNVPEGAIVAMPMCQAGNSRLKSFLIGSATGAVEPLGTMLVLALAAWLTPAMPALLAFAAGAMLYVVVEELIPEASNGNHSNLATVGFAIGFALMMVMDVVFAE